MRSARVLLACMLMAALAPAPARGADASAAGHHAELRGIRMYYELHGSGPPLLLLHGGAGNGMQFEKQVPAFAATHLVIVPDCRAQGRTTDRPGPLTYHGMAEDVLALLDRLGLKRVDIMGWSDGGNIGLDLAMHHPGRVAHLVTFGANFRPDGLEPADVRWNQTATPDSFGAGMREGWTKLNPQPGNYERAMAKILELWRTQPRWTAADLGRIRARCLICAGEHDVVRPAHTAALARAIPGARTWIVPGASHGAMLEQPELVNAKVLEFLSAGS
ncbi:MAG: alpha/beta hydrolase [Candidatus Eisenbacteria bacterium]|nr:alpha/beta hydrolase [Candidatus Eisenbacteria bacterium]